jgi:RNA polymerase sigma factor (sigma-70 family)
VKYINDLELAKKIDSGNSLAWNNFVNTYTDYVLAYVIKWCNSTCSIISNNEKECEVKKLKSNSFPETNNTCDQGLDLYEYVFRSLRKKISKYQGKSSLKTYMTACFKNIYNDFFIEKYGKIVIPDALKDLSDFDKKVYKIICRSSNIDSVIDKLDLPKEEVLNSYNRIISRLEAEGKVWQHVLSKFTKNTPVLNLKIIIDGEEENKDVPTEKNYDEINIEFKEIFLKSLNQIDSKQKRVLELKFSKGLDAKTIFEKFSNFFNWKRESEFYPFIDKAVKALVERILDNYKEKDVNPDIKLVKESLEDFFKIINY